MKLIKKKWKPFKINELFDVDKGTYLNKNKILNGDIPFISAKATNNGITGFIGNDTLFPKNSITIEKIKLSAFYQPKEFYCSHDVTVVQNDNLNKKTALFICAMINRQGIKYSYGRQAQMNVVKRETILLPINSNNEPDWEFIKNYTNNKYNKIESRYTTYLNNKIEKLMYVKIPTLNDKKWEEFDIIDLFTNIQRGKRITRVNQITGNTPYVSSSSLNNGVDNFIQNDNKIRKFSNCISLANSGSVGSTFYHPYEFVGSDHITHLKNDKFNKFIYLFIATITNRLTEKYNFNREINDKRIKREKIMLPINKNGKPDYEYMEQYIKNLMILKYESYKNRRS